MFAVIATLATWQLIKYKNADADRPKSSLGNQDSLPPAAYQGHVPPPIKPVEPAKEGKPLDVNVVGAEKDTKGTLAKPPSIPEPKKPTQELKDGVVEEKPQSSTSKEDAVPEKATSPKKQVDSNGDTILVIPAAQDEVPLKPVAGGGQGRMEVDPLPSDAPKEHWKKPKEHFPVSTTVQLPTGTPKAIPSIQFAFKQEKESAKEDREKKRQMIEKSFLKSWNSYKEYAWMHDELSPVTGGHRDPFAGWGATLVDTLDTLWMMGLKEEFETSVKAVEKIDFTTSPRKDIPLFETTIRYLGGLIAAYDISGEKYKVLLDKAVELAEILIGAFDTPNRMPLTFYYWTSAYASQPHRADTKVTLAELGSLSIEFTRLSQLTKEPKYYDAISRITDALEEWQPDTRLPGLWPSDVDASGCKKSKSRLKADSQKPKQIESATKSKSEDDLVGGSEEATNLKSLDAKAAETLKEALRNPEAFKDVTADDGKPKKMVTLEKPDAWVFDPDDDSQEQKAKAELVGPVAGKSKIQGWGGADDDSQQQKAKVEQDGPVAGKSKIQGWSDGLDEEKMIEMGKSLRGQVHKRAVVDLEKSRKVDDDKSQKDEKSKSKDESPKKEDVDKENKFLSPEKVSAMEKEAKGNEDEEGEDRPGLSAYDADDLCTPQGLAAAPDAKCDEYTLGGRADSVYEYLPKQWLLLGGLSNQYKKMYDMAVDAFNKHLVFRPMIKEEKRNIRIAGSYTTCDATGGGLKPDSQHLTCFAGAMLGLGAKIYPDTRNDDLDLAKKITDGCVWAYEATTTGIMPEVFHAIPCDDVQSCEWNESHWHHMIDPHPEWREQAASRLHLPLDAKHLDPETQVDNKVGGKLDVGRTKAALDNPALARLAEEGGQMNQKRELGVNREGSKKSAGIVQKDEDIEMLAPLDHEEFVKMRIEDERLPPGMSSIPSKKYILRPEAIESVFYMYRLTGEQYWVDKGWKMFLAIQAYTATELGNSAIDDVTKRVPKPLDEMESFWLAETLKYFYLLFSDPSLVSLDEWVL